MRTFRYGLAITMVLMTLLGSGLAAAAPDNVNNEYFQHTWDRTDRPVAEGEVDRTWVWGSAISGELSEPYSDSPSGQRTVQYFDKSRMEITHPDSGDPASPWYVTNGLLVRELITGWVQVGDVGYEPGLPSELNVAGDQGFPNGPSYATFRHYLPDPYGPEFWDQTGEFVNKHIDRSGAVTRDVRLDELDATYAHFDEITGHNIAAPFWEFMHSTGTVFIDEAYSEAPMFANPYSATGRPLIEPYWSNVVVAGTEKQVLIQCFERRCLTYTPDNPEGWQIEAGNVGQHYYQWRYGEAPDLSGQLLFISSSYNEVTGRYVDHIHTVNADGTDRRNLTSEFEADVNEPAWSPDGNRIAFASEGDLYVMNADGSDLDQITSGAGVDAAPVWSPDGSRVAFERALSEGMTQIFVVAPDGSGEYQLTSIPADAETSVSHDPAWSPDGELIAFVNINGTVPPPLPQTLYLIHADGSGFQELVSSYAMADPEWSPDGDRLYYELRPTGDHDLSGGSIHVIDLFADPVEDRMIVGEDSSHPYALEQSPDGSRLAMIKTGAGYNESPFGIVTMNLEGQDVSQLTHFGRSLDWSPGGDALAFWTWTEAPDTEEMAEVIAVVNADGSDPHIVTFGGYHPLWRP